MSVIVPPIEARLAEAVSHYWSTLHSQANRQSAGDADRGNRSAVTGGKQMDGFRDLVSWLLAVNGMDDGSIYDRNRRELPGYFRPTKDWDMVVVHNGHLIAAIEFKSHRGPSFGNNFNNRVEEALGSATDLWTAYREEACGGLQPRPWLGWMMLLEDSPGSTSSVRVAAPHFPVRREFVGASYADRYKVMLRKFVAEKLYDGVALLLTNERDGLHGRYTEPESDLAMKSLLASLAGHAAAYLATTK